jgi:hypothetical protein
MALLKNVREVVQRIVSRNHAALKQRQKDAGSSFVRSTRKSAAVAKLQLRRLARLRRQAWYEEVVELYRHGKSIAAIAQHLQMSPTTVRKFVYAGAFPERSAHRSRRIVRLEPYLPYLEQRVQQGCENASLLWQEICEQGFTHGYKVVNTCDSAAGSGDQGNMSAKIHNTLLSFSSRHVTHSDYQREQFRFASVSRMPASPVLQVSLECLLHRFSKMSSYLLLRQ